MTIHDIAQADKNLSKICKEQQHKELMALRCFRDDIRRIIRNAGRSSSISKDLLERSINELEGTQ